jgi:hypothetical protein
MSLPPTFRASIDAWGTARLALPAIPPLRKSLPAWVPECTAGHFLKYVDEQTVTAVAAVDKAVQSHEIDLSQRRDWPIIAAPRFQGRIAGPAVIRGYDRGGPQSVSPHIIPQNSLHSISGALSILLASHGPNVGVGGGPESLDDAILAAFSLPGASGANGCWLVATAWDPEPVADRQGRFLNEPLCHAFALSLRFATTGLAGGELQFQAASTIHRETRSLAPPMSVSHIASQLDQLVGGETCHLAWPLAWGGEVALSVRAWRAATGGLNEHAVETTFMSIAAWIRSQRGHALGELRTIGNHHWRPVRRRSSPIAIRLTRTRRPAVSPRTAHAAWLG